MSPPWVFRGGKAAEKRSGEIAILHGWTGAELPPVNKMIKNFERKSGILVRSEELSWESLRVEIGARIDRDPPDLFPREVGPELYELADGRKLADITDIWKENKFYDAFPDWMVEECLVGKSAIATPIKVYTFAVWYITKTFKKHGIEPPETWSEFLEVCRKLKKRGVPPMVASSWGNSIWFNHLLLGMAGPKFYQDLMEGRASWTDSRVVDAYELLKDLTDEFFLPHPFTYDFGAEWSKINRGEAAMMLQGDWMNGMWQNQYGYTPAADHDFFLLPPVNPEVRTVMVVGGNVWVTPRLAPNLKNAKRFMAYAGSLEAHEILAREGMGILARKEVPEDAYDPVLVRLRREIFSRRTAFGMWVHLHPEVIAVEERIRREVLLSPRAERDLIKGSLAEIDAVAERHSH
ncbi:MAG: extracellular solute-binding protein [Candidatus Hadarchaeales archaeon]